MRCKMYSQLKLISIVSVDTTANLLRLSFGKLHRNQSSDSFTASSDEHDISLDVFVLPWPEEEDGANKGTRDAHRNIRN